MNARTRTLALVFGGLLISSAVQAVPVHLWSGRFGEGGPQISRAVAVAPNGDVVVIGEFMGTIDLGGGPVVSAGNFDVFVARFDAGGSYLWSKTFGTPNEDQGRGVAVDAAGNVLIAGSFQGSIDFGGGTLVTAGAPDIFVAKYDASGSHLWSKRFGDIPIQRAYSVAVDALGNVALGGAFGGTVDFGGGPLVSAGLNDMFVAEFDASGAHLWSKRFGDADEQGALGVAIQGGSIAVTGSIFGSVDFGGGPLVTAGSGDVFVARFGVGGLHLWSKVFGDASYQSGSAVALDGAGDVIITGNLSGSADFGGGVLAAAGGSDVFVAKFDPSGAHLWSNRFGDASGQSGLGVTMISPTDILLAGSFVGSIDFGGGPLASVGGSDAYLVHLAGNGAHVWSTAFGGAGGQCPPYGVGADGSGRIAIAGQLGGTVSFGGPALTSAGSVDAYVAEYHDDQVIPVLIQAFDAVEADGAVRLQWDVWSDEDIESFALYRRESPRVGSSIIAQDQFLPGMRSYVDTRVEPGRTYYYTLVLHTGGGMEVQSPEVMVAVAGLGTTLGQNHPNPFNPSTTIEYTLERRASVAVDIFDVSGAFVARLDQGEREPGRHTLEWNGRDSRNRPVGSGIYFYRLEGVRGAATRKMGMLK